MKLLTLKTLLLSSSVLFSISPLAEMAPMDEEELENQTGQAGITLSSKAEFNSGTRISYTNKDADYKDSAEYWLVIHELTGSLELKDLKIDVVNDFGPAKNKGAIQVTLPTEIVAENLKTEGIYVGPGHEKGNTHQFLLGVEIDGTLSLPAAGGMQVNLFPTEGK